MLEAMERYPEAKRDYKSVLAAAPNDPSAWNNLVRTLSVVCPSAELYSHVMCTGVDKLRLAKMSVKLTSVPEPTLVAHSAVPLNGVSYYQCAQGNSTAQLGDWAGAAECFAKAAALAPEFSFAAANHALAAYQIGQTDSAVREMTYAAMHPCFCRLT